MNLRWDGSRPESGDSGVEIQHDHNQSQGPSRHQKMIVEKRLRRFWSIIERVYLGKTVLTEMGMSVEVVMEMGMEMSEGRGRCETAMWN